MTANTRLGRRDALALSLAAGAAALPRRAHAQAKEVKIAMLVPLSGPWARAGLLEQMGAELAIDEINAAGGIAAMGGARMRLMTYDTGDSAETAKNAAQRMLAAEPDLVGGFGCWLSSFTLAATEITERAALPWLTLSYSDLITDRGFKYVFQTAPTGGQQAHDLVPILVDLATRTTGKRPTRIAMVGDNTGAAVAIRKALEEKVLPEQKITVALNQIYTPPLTDATPVVQPVRAARPDFALLLSTNPSDDKLLADKFVELGMGGGRLPLIGNGGHWATPELLRIVGKDNLQSMIVGLANWPGKRQAELSRIFVERTKEAWFGHDSLFAYAHVRIFKEALERAGAADRAKVAAAIRGLDMTDGPALLFPDGRIKFDAKGRREGARMVIIQFQNGKWETISPTEMATAQPIWKSQTG
jgi:branched-chain amino acid transport system substrate-binding protein